ncbi:MAG: transporter substrate-binding domain-containing protein [Vallitalea sp.]|jgi:ABC-type amino acid transport substrate-binding protein/EAL domain-containing protein (putative c-di-GMP-specific phosphodiesterase class I)|nr:transporter substrate-binding domain-containing protein [Vallitalea sp.]
MKKKILFISSIILITITIVFTIFTNNNDKLKLTDEEMKYIEQNKDTIFKVGYFPTPAERRFCIKLCKKIEEDTSLKLKIYDDTWNNTLALIKNSSLPIVMNMNKTVNRKKYALFTEPLEPISCGIYSGEENTITSFNDINGKVIGAERETALSESFPNEYPNLSYTLQIYDTFEETRKAFEDREIDGFLSTKSYDENVKGLHFFAIDSITLDTNHIGVSKEYPILYSIISKEIEILKKEKWDILVSDIINFELEKSLVDFTDIEKKYLSQKKIITVGLPTEYFLYAYGEEYNLKGILPKILEKVQFISNSNFSYKFDKLENLRLREDIDFYIDYEKSKDYVTNSVFTEDIIIASTSDKKSIKEVYDLSIYNVGIFGVPKAKNSLIHSMPNIKLKEYNNIEDANSDIKKRNLDYLIMPRLYFENTTENFSYRGDFDININRFVSDDKMIINIIDKCLFIIDTDKIIENEIIKTANNKIPLKIIFLLIILLSIVLLGIKALKTIWNLQYKDSYYGLYNIKYLDKMLKNKSCFLILVELIDVDIIKAHYGNKIFEKYINKFIMEIKTKLSAKEYIVYLGENRFLLATNTDIEKFIPLLKKIKHITINKILLMYKKRICYYDFEGDESISIILEKMHLGMKIEKERNDIIHLTNQKYEHYKNRIAKDIMIKQAIEKGEINTTFRDIVNNHENIVAKYVDIKLDGVNQNNLYKIAKRLDIEIKLDKLVLSRVLKANSNKPILIKVSSRTLLSEKFFDYLLDRISKNITLIIIIDFEVYEENIDVLIKNENIQYAIENFGQNLKNDCAIKYYDIENIILDNSLCTDIEENSEVIEFIKTFAKNNNKKIFTRGEYFGGNNSDNFFDYYIREEIDENTDC